MAEKKIRTPRDTAASKTYQYNGRARLYQDKFIIPGDYLYEIEKPDSQCAKTFISSRGYTVGYYAEEGRGDNLGKALESGELVQVSEKTLDEVRERMMEQFLYKDAESYRAAPDGSKAQAVFDTGRGRFSLERDGDNVTLVNGVSGGYSSLPDADYAAFNPSGAAINLEDDWQRHDRQERERAAGTPLGKVAAAIKSTALKLSGREVGEIAKPIPKPEALARMHADMQPTVHGAGRGAVISWTNRIAGHGMGMSTMSSHYGLVTGDDGKYMSMIELFAPDGRKAPDGYDTIPVGSDGLLKGWTAAPGLTYSLDAEQYRKAGGWVMFGGGKLPEDEVARLENMEPVPGGPMDELNGKVQSMDCKEAGDAPAGPEA